MPVSPLRGVRVLDLSQAVSGPLAGRILADLGADVVKVEWPRPDTSNFFGARRAGISGLFTQMNAGKRGIGIDRSGPEGVELVRSLALQADVVIENFRPGVLDKAGLGYGDLGAINSRLVMLSISGFGRTSPQSQRRAYAPVIHAEAGVLARQARFDNRTPADLGLALADTIAALHGTIALLAALRLRDETGQGQHIDLGMLHAMIASDDYTHNAIDGISDPYPSRGEIWSAAGGPIMVAADAKTLWSRFATYTCAPDPASADDDEPARAAARRAVVASWIASFSERAALVAALDAANLAWADLQDPVRALESTALMGANIVVDVDDHAGGTRGVVRMPYNFSSAESAVRGRAPRRGQDNEAVLAGWLGLGDEEVAKLRAAGVLLD